MTYNKQPNQTDITSAIASRVARFTSIRMTKAQHDTMSSEICATVVAAQPSCVDQSVAWMTILTGFIADVARPEGGTLGEYLNEATISRWVSLGINEGKSRKTLRTRRGILSRMLRAHRGVAANITNGAARKPTSAPLSLTEIESLATSCIASSTSAWRGFVAHVGAGVPVATLGARFTFDIFTTVAAADTTRLVAYQGVTSEAFATLDGEYLIDADWEALLDVADGLNIALTRGVVNQTYRLLAVCDERFSIAERLNHYSLNGPNVTGIAHFLVQSARVLSEIDKMTLRDGTTSSECPAKGFSAPSSQFASRKHEEDVKPLTRKTSRAAAQRLAQALSAQLAAKKLQARPVEDYLATFIPDRDDAIWETIAPTMRSSVVQCGYVTVQKAREHAVAMAAYLRWRAQRGSSIAVKAAMTFSAIDEFYVHGMPDLSKRTRGDYRLRLRTIARACNASVDAPPSLELGHNAVNPGYSLAEERELRRWARMQSQPEVRRRLCAIVGLCGGAGLSSTELRALRRNDITIDADGTIVVDVGGQRPRQTVVRRIYEAMTHIAIEGLDPEGLLLPALKSSSPITAIIKGADDLGCTVTLDTRRLRTTWICWLMGQRVSLQLAFEASGLQSARTFTEMLAHLPAIANPAELRDGGAK